MRSSFISTEDLKNHAYAGIIGYPHATARQIRRRIDELEKLGINAVLFAGPVTIGKLGVLGKGYVGVVVLARRKTKKVALKIRRLDSQRNSMKGEAALLRTVNSVGVGPKFYDASKNFLVMEYVEGQKIGDWVRSVSGRGSVGKMKFAVRRILEDCYKLDQAGIDHGELSSITKHVIIGNTKQTMIDFESSSTHRKVSNVTSATQAMFIGSGISKSVQRIYKVPPKQKIIEALRSYKKEQSRQSFEELLAVLKLQAA